MCNYRIRDETGRALKLALAIFTRASDIPKGQLLKLALAIFTRASDILKGQLLALTFQKFKFKITLSSF
jgi:hypothetical protein